jgi:hypothetical protein
MVMTYTNSGDYDQMLQYVIPAKAGIQRLANMRYVYVEDLYDRLIGITGFQPSLE